MSEHEGDVMMLPTPHRSKLYHGHDESLLDDDSYSVLYPGGTRTFASQFHYSIRVWVIVIVLVAFSIICLAVPLGTGFGSDSSRRISEGFLISALVGDIILFWIIYSWNNQDLDLYVERVRAGLWSEGVFVFSTGDIVVRYNSMFLKLDQEFPSSLINGAMANRSKNQLIIMYSDEVTGEERQYCISGSILLDSITEIASCINNSDAEPL